MSSYIIFQADKGQPHWKGRKLAHTGMGTNILAEHWYGDNSAPKIGDRLTEFVKIEGHEEPEFPGASTHYRDGDWEICRIEEYTPEMPVGNSFNSIYICFCKYLPIASELKPLPPIQVSIDSFGGDEIAYKEYRSSRVVSVAK